MATIYKRGKYWWVAYQEDGLRIQKSLKVGDEKSARVLLRHYRSIEQAAVLRGTPLEGAVSIEQWKETYLKQRAGRVAPGTIRRERQAIASLQESIPKTKLAAYSKGDIETWFGRELETGATATANCKLRHVKVFFNAAVEQKFLTASPCRYVKQAKETTRLVRVLSADEVRAVFKVLPAPWRDLAEVGLKIGARLGEICRLKVGDVHLDAPSPSVFIDSTPDHPTKSKRARVVPIPKTGMALFTRLTTNRPKDAPLVPGPDGPFRPDWVTHRFPRYAKEAGVTCTFHDLRRTYGAWLVMAGADLATVQANLGHSDISTTIKHYVHLVIKHRAAQTDLFPEFL